MRSFPTWQQPLDPTYRGMALTLTDFASEFETRGLKLQRQYIQTRKFHTHNKACDQTTELHLAFE